MPAAVIRPDTFQAWAGQSLLVVNTHGECGDDQGLSGYYFREARFLDRVQLRIDGAAPWRCEAAAINPDALAFTYVHPEIAQTGEGSRNQRATRKHDIPERALDIRVQLVVDAAHLDVSAAITNRSRRAVAFNVSWRFGADFADIQEAEEGKRQQRAAVKTTRADGTLQFAYQHRKLPYVTRIRALDARPWRARGQSLTTELHLEPQERADMAIRVQPSGTNADLTENEAIDRREVVNRWRANFARLEVPGNRLAEQILAHSVRDFGSFALLEGARDEWLTLQAGVPLYPVLFGRDALTAGWQAALIDRGEALSAALVRLGRMQSNRFDDWHDEEPGRLPYQMRNGPLELLNRNPDLAYYADYAGPLMYVISLANLYAWNGDRAVVQRHWDTARRVLDWAREYGDSDRDGYLEYQTKSSRGTKNEGWKDSDDAIVYDDGRLVAAPIATCELQAYWYAAQSLMGALAWMRGERADAAAYRKSAAELKERFNRDWWMPDKSFFGLAMDRHKRLVRAVTSNVGQCVACGIVDAAHLRPVVDRLFAPDLFSGWGIRTLASSHAFYNPLSYHRGPVWPVEQATILFGLRRFGFNARAQQLAGALFDLAQLYPEHRIPECVGGYARSEMPTPAAYPHANAPQLWSATAFPLTIQALLGIVPLAPFDSLIVDPVLPAWLPDLIVHDLRVGGATVSLRFWRDAHGHSKWKVLRKDGTLHIVRQPPPESIEAGLAERAAAVLDTVRHASA
jgi:glycogen debranching enzyme